MKDDAKRPDNYLKRAGLSTLLILLSALMIWGNSLVRVFEAAAASAILNVVFGVPNTQPLFAPQLLLSGEPPFTVAVSEYSSAAFVIAPFAFVAAMMVLSTRFSVLHVLGGLSVAAVLLMETSALRIALLAATVRWWAWEEHPLLQALLTALVLSIGVGAASVVSWIIAVDSSSSAERH